MPNINLGWNFLKLFFLCSWDRNITVHTVFDIYYRIYSIPTHDKKPVAVTTVYSAPDDGRKGRPKRVELLTPNKEHKIVASLWHLYV